MSMARRSRRGFLHSLTAAALGLVATSRLPRPLHALARAADDPPEAPNEEVRRLLDEICGGRPIQTGALTLDMPTVAEDGRTVPVIIEADLPMTEAQYVKAVHLVVDHNPDAHLAAFHLTPAIGALAIETRIKMKRTTWVRAIAETSDGQLHGAYAKVTVSLNGCG